MLLVSTCFFFYTLLVFQHAQSLKLYAHAAGREEEKTPVWILYSYTEKNSLIELNIKALKRHLNRKFRLMFVNETNERELIPDLPEEYFRLPYHAARSDIIRASLLAHHGGIYLDADILAMQDLLDMFAERLSKNDVVAYTSDGQDCNRGSFSSNAMGANKGSEMFQNWWKRAKSEMRKQCVFSEEEDLKNGVCCYTPAGVPRKCHVPWAALGENIGHSELKRLLSDIDRRSVRISCLSEEKFMGLAPDMVGEVLFQPLTQPPRNKEEIRCQRGRDCPCWESPAKSGDLECAGRDTKFKNFFGRPGFHLFESVHGYRGKQSQKEILENNWVVSRLYRSTFGLQEPRAPDYVPTKENT